MPEPYRRDRVTLPDGRVVSYSRRLRPDAHGRPSDVGPPVDGWVDGVPLTDVELRALLDSVRTR